MIMKKNLYQSFRGQLLFDEPLSQHTSLKVGGPADLYAIPEDLDDLLLLLKLLQEEKLCWLMTGGGCNLLVADAGYRGAVISLKKLNRTELLPGGRIRGEAGVENLSLVRFGQRHSLGGIGFMAGIPGTLGGAVRMNAGAYGCAILDRLLSLQLIRNGAPLQLEKGELVYGYRRLELEEGDIIISALLQLEPVEPEVTEEEICDDQELRKNKHNVGHPSAGSFFKNPPDQAAWSLIDAAGMRGCRVGNAMMSELHSNFMINLGGATAADCLQLASKVKGAVLAATGVLLEEEVQIVGVE